MTVETCTLAKRAIVQRNGTPAAGPDAALAVPAERRIATTTMAAATGDDEGVGLGVTPTLSEVDGVGVVEGVDEAVGCAVSEVDVEPVTVLDGEPLNDDAALADIVELA